MDPSSRKMQPYGYDEEQEQMEYDEPEKEKQSGDDESDSEDRQESSSKSAKKNASGALDTSDTPSNANSSEEKDVRKSRKSESSSPTPRNEEHAGFGQNYRFGNAPFGNNGNAVMVEEYKEPAGFGSFGQNFKFGDAPFGVGADNNGNGFGSFGQNFKFGDAPFGAGADNNFPTGISDYDDYNNSDSSNESRGYGYGRNTFGFSAENSTFDAIPELPAGEDDDDENTEQNVDSATTKYKAPTGFGSFRPINRFGNHIPFGARADKPTTSAESQNMSTDGPILDYGDYNFSDSSNEFKDCDYVISATTEYKAPTGFGSSYRFGDNAPFGNAHFGADKPTSAKSHLPPSSSTVHRVKEKDYAGNISASKDKADKKSMSKEIKKVAMPKKVAKSPAKAPLPEHTLTMKRDMELQLDCIKRERLTEDDEKQYLLEVWMNANEVSDQVPELCERFNKQKTTGKKTADAEIDPEVFTDSDFVEREIYELVAKSSGKKSRTDESAAKTKRTAESSGTHSSRKSASKKVSNKPKEADTEAEYKVNGILGRRIEHNTGQHEYLVHWEGYGDDENTWEPLKNLAHLDVFKEYIAQQKSVGSSRRKNATPKKIVKFKNYASKSSEALSSTHAAATKADDDEQSDKDPPSEEDEDDVHNGTAEMDETGKDESDKDGSNEEENEDQDDDEMDHQADANADEQLDDEEESDEEESGEDKEEYEVEEVLQRRMTTIKGKKTWKYLVTWKGYNDQTWEPHDNVEHLKVVQKYIARENAKAAEKPEASTKSRKRVRTRTSTNNAKSSTSSRATRKSPRLAKRKRVTRQSARSGKQ